MDLLRDQLPWLSSYIYLNYGASGPILSDAASKMCALIEQSKEPVKFHIEEWCEILNAARRSVSHLINASQDEIAFVTGTSHGLSLIANAVVWKKGDVVLFPEDEFASNRFVWENLKEKGVEARAIKPDKEIPFEVQLEKMDLKGVRLVSCSAISYYDGRKHHLEKISKVCQKNNLLFVVDGIQAVGATNMDVKAIDCDFLSCGGQKWLFGPIGTGFVYIKKERIPELFVSQVGWGSAKQPFKRRGPLSSFAEGAKRFEPGYVNLPAIAALATSIEVMNKVGFEKIYRRIEELTDRAKEEIGASVITPKEKGGIITIKSSRAEEIQKKLEAKRIVATQRDDCLRISLHAPVLDKELEAFLEVYLG